jgi:hypothetical protein
MVPASNGAVLSHSLVAALSPAPRAGVTGLLIPSFSDHDGDDADDGELGRFFYRFNLERHQKDL